MLYRVQSGELDRIVSADDPRSAAMIAVNRCPSWLPLGELTSVSESLDEDDLDKLFYVMTEHVRLIH